MSKKNSSKDFESKELIDELESRGYWILKGHERTDLDEYDDEEIEDEFLSRNIEGIYEVGEKMFEAFSLGKTEEAIILAKKIAEICYGRGLCE